MARRRWPGTGALDRELEFTEDRSFIRHPAGSRFPGCLDTLKLECSWPISRDLTAALQQLDPHPRYPQG